MSNDKGTQSRRLTSFFIPFELLKLACNSLKKPLINYLINSPFSCCIQGVLLHNTHDTMKKTCALILYRLMGFTAVKYSSI